MLRYVLYVAVVLVAYYADSLFPFLAPEVSSFFFTYSLGKRGSVRFPFRYLFPNRTFEIVKCLDQPYSRKTESNLTFLPNPFSTPPSSVPTS